MKILFLVFVFLSFSLMKIVIINDASQGTPQFAFPTFDPPSFDFIDLSGGCASFIDCIEYVGAVLYNIALAIIWFVLFIVELVTYIFEVLAVLIQAQFTGIDGAPPILNVMFSVMFGAAMALIIFKLVRSGRSES